MKRLGNRTAPPLRLTVLGELNEKIKQLELGATLPWFLQDVWLGVTVANQDWIDLPTDYLREDDEGISEIQDTTVSPAQWRSNFPKVSYNLLRKNTANTLAQLPQAYAVFGEKAYFGPTPNGVYNVRIPYNKRTTPIVDSSDVVTNKWLLNFLNVVTLHTISIVAATHTRDMNLVKSIGPELGLANDLMQRAIEARIHAGRDYLLDDTEN